jgi:perosamine synthetase
MIPWARPLLFGDEAPLIAEALQSTAISGGPFIDRFENEFCQFHGNGSRGLLVANGTAALELPMRALGIGPGDEVIVPGFGFAAAANMTLACGAKPVLADVTDDTWLIDPEDVRRRLRPHTRAIVAVHSYGNLCDLAALADIAREAGVALIEDCAESLFSRYRERPCGTWGDVGTFSFQATKTITCGEGGLVLARDAKLVERMRLIGSHGMRADKKYWHHTVGYNFRLTNLQAAMLCAQWRHREELAQRRRQVYGWYQARLADHPGLRFPRICDEVAPVMWAVAIRLDPNRIRMDRDALIVRMLADGIETRPGFYPLSAQPPFAGPPVGNSERLASQIISLPASPTLAEAEVDQVCARLLALVD